MHSVGVVASKMYHFPYPVPILFLPDSEMAVKFHVFLYFNLAQRKRI